MDRRTRQVLGHIAGTSTSYGTGVNMYSTFYNATSLPDRPTYGWLSHDVACRSCENVYRVQIGSNGARLFHACVRWVFFPLLILASMIAPEMMGMPDTWILYFASAIACFIVYRKMYGTRGIRPPRLLAKPDKKAKHRIFTPQS